MNDSFNLKRFLDAQNPEYEAIAEELRSGRKSGHWIWYVFPQVRGLGSSSNSDYYGISSSEEALAYAKHPVLGERLLHCTNLVVAVQLRSAKEIFGEIDSVKFRSSMTLFAQVEPDEGIFMRALEQYFDGRPDPLTLRILGADKNMRAGS